MQSSTVCCCKERDMKDVTVVVMSLPDCSPDRPADCPADCPRLDFPVNEMSSYDLLFSLDILPSITLRLRFADAHVPPSNQGCCASTNRESNDPGKSLDSGFLKAHLTSIRSIHPMLGRAGSRASMFDYARSSPEGFSSRTP